MNLATLTHLVGELVGGLGIFLLGMKYMSEGMQAVAGTSLRRLIGTVTGNRFFAVIVGVLVTCVVQSSSITTVMVVGFVNSGVMSLAQAVGVIMGANIGTTITGWILVLKIGKYGLPLLGAAAFVYLFSRHDRYRYWGMGIMGIGMVFFGLELMKDACALIKEAPDFAAWFQAFQADSYLGVLKCCMAGCILTTMVQSSSATLGITISLAFQGVISYETAAALVLGENVGTTITALLASLGATTNAKRAAYFHVLFNMLGVFWITLLFPWYIELVQWVLNVDISKAVIVDGGVTYPGTTPAIAATHSIFNVANVLLFMPLVPTLVSFLERIVPAKESSETLQLTDLDVRMLDTPALALEQSHKELERMGDSCEKMLRWLVDLRNQGSADITLAKQLSRCEQALDSVQDEVTDFITKLLSKTVPHVVANAACKQLRIADEYESVSDYVADLDRFDRKLQQSGFRFSSAQRQSLDQLNDDVLAYLEQINAAFRQENRNIYAEAATDANVIREKIKQFRRQHLDNLSESNMAPKVNVAVLAALNAYGRVLGHSENIAEVISGDN